ncbi:unnamed protein product [Caenorhabditis auriculariae]|uniref:Uncharacterized protein n=1 Tax=Caenorhabditis auriculariae TaxID=2777116 RepID=A0A8S1H4M5_9PELO|nr:unnamed protein product [Caenorhabditis auriculariae]
MRRFAREIWAEQIPYLLNRLLSSWAEETLNLKQITGYFSQNGSLLTRPQHKSSHLCRRMVLQKSVNSLISDITNQALNLDPIQFQQFIFTPVLSREGLFLLNQTETSVLHLQLIQKRRNTAARWPLIRRSDSPQKQTKIPKATEDDDVIEK